jgi:prepilin-type N-terminal cleavage/methylation domain-containing protein
MKCNSTIRVADRQTGFSLIELLIAMTITLTILALAFYLLAQSLNRKSRAEDQAIALADARQSLSVISREISNSGFGLNSNGLVAADCTENKIRVRANLNALKKETTSDVVTDPDEDISFYLVSNPGGGSSSLVRSDINQAESAIVATRIDNTDLNSDGKGDGLIFRYLDKAGTEVPSSDAVSIEIAIRIKIPQEGEPGTPGYQPEAIKQLTSLVVLRNSRLLSY